MAICIQWQTDQLNGGAQLAHLAVLCFSHTFLVSLLSLKQYAQKCPGKKKQKPYWPHVHRHTDK